MFDIDLEHPDYAALKGAWTQYRDLYVGGEQLRARAGSYLIPRQKEPREVYGERLSRVFYENYIGSIVDWYAATLFRREPVLKPVTQCAGRSRLHPAFRRGSNVRSCARRSSPAELARCAARDVVPCRPSEPAASTKSWLLVPSPASSWRSLPWNRRTMHVRRRQSCYRSVTTRIERKFSFGGIRTVIGQFLRYVR